MKSEIVTEVKHALSCQSISLKYGVERIFCLREALYCQLGFQLCMLAGINMIPCNEPKLRM